MNLSQRVLWNTVVQIAGKAVLLLASLATLRLATAYLGVEGFGQYAIVLSLAPILLVFADLGLSTLLARELVHAPDRRDDLAGTLLWFRLGASALVVLICCAVVPLLPYDREVRVGLVLAAFGVALTSLGSFAAPFFQVNLRLDLLALLDCGTALLTVGGIALVTQLDLGFYALVGANVVAGLASASVSYVLVRRFWRPSLRFDRPLARRLAADAWPLAAVVVLGLLHFRLDAVLLSLLRSPEDVGIYAVAFRFVEQALVLPVVFMAAVFPLLAANVHGPGAADVIRKAFSFLLMIGVPLALALVALADPLVALVAGDGFGDAALPLRILAPAVVLTFVSAIFSGVLVALNRQRALILVSLAGITVNVLANLYAIPRFGYVGAATTTVISEAFGLCAVYVLARRACAFRLSPRLVTRADVALLFGR